MTTTTTTKVSRTKKGGNLTKQLSDLAVPFGLILAKQSLENFLKKESAKSKSETKPEKKSVKAKKVSLSGGEAHHKVHKHDDEKHGGKKVLSKKVGGGSCTASTDEMEGFKSKSVLSLASVGGNVKKSPRTKKN